MKCMFCDENLTPGDRHCGECGKPAPSADLQRWRDLCAPACDDGLIDAVEEERLELERRRQGMPLDLHRQVLASLGVLTTPPVTVALDERSVEDLVVGRTTSLEFEIKNTSSSVRTGVRLVLLAPGAPLVDRRLAAIRGNDVVRLHCDAIPTQSGRSRIEGIVTVPVGGDRYSSWSFSLPVRIDAATGGPQTVSMHIQNHAVMTADDMNLQMSARGSTQTDRKWKSVHMEPIGTGDAARRRWTWGLGARSVDALIQSEGSPGLLALTTRSANGEKQVWVTGAPQLTMGRDAARSDVRLAVEPFLPAEAYPENVQASMRISGRHLVFGADRTGARVTDLGSTVGTAVNGEAVPANTPIPIEGETTLVKAGGTLDLRVQTIPGTDGTLAGLWIRRLANLPARSYLLVVDGVAWDLSAGVPADRHDIPTAVVFIRNGVPHLANLTSEAWQTTAGPVLPGRAFPLSVGATVEWKGGQIRCEAKN